MAKRRKLKKQVYFVLIGIVLFIGLIIFGINRYNLYKYHQTSEYKLLEINKIRFTPKCAIIKFKGINSLNDILPYKNQILFVPEDIAREFLEDDEYLIDELVGLDVYDGEKKVGAIVGVSNNGASDLLSVKTKSKKISLVPFVKAIVLSVDIKSRRIQINNIEGLLE